jgi:thermitase
MRSLSQKNHYLKDGPVKTHFPQHLPKLTILTLGLTAAFLASCNSTPTPEVTTLEQYAYVQTVDITSNDTTSSIESQYQGKIVTWQPEAGFAILETNVAPNQVSVSAVTGTVVPTNTGVITIAEGSRAWAGGSRAWAGGSRAWAGGGLVNIFLGDMEIWAPGWGSRTTASTPYATASSKNMYAFIGSTYGLTIGNLFGFTGGIYLSDGQKLAPKLGKGLKVAVIDTGVDLKHPGLAGDSTQPSHLAPATDWKDFVDGDAIPQEVSSSTSNNEGYGHGMGVAGLILQVAPYASIMPIRVLNSDGIGDSSNVVKAIEWAVNHGAKVINLSLGTLEPSEELRTMVAWATSKGVFTVTAAGNNDNTQAMYPAAYAKDAASGGARLISVGNTGSRNINGDLVTPYVLGKLGLPAKQFDEKSPISVYGSNVELYAPGELMMTLAPEAQVGPWTGTSFATPVVAGSLALALAEPLSATQLARVPTAITSSADPIASSNTTVAGNQSMVRLNVNKFMKTVLGIK